MRIASLRHGAYHFRVMMVCAMLPLTILSGQATHGCICADGHYELLCKAGKCREERRSVVAPASHTTCCGCTSCGRGSSADDSHNCSSGKLSCCRQSVAHALPGKTNSAGFDRTGCCTPVVQAAAAATVISSPQVGDDHQQLALNAIVIEAGSLQVGAPFHHQLLVDTGPPPDDLVVTLGRLVI